LKKAWVKRCIKVRDGAPNPKVKTRNPSCDSVLKATIFFKSFSTKANNPDKKLVIIPTINRTQRSTEEDKK